MELAILERQKCTMVKPQAYLRAEKTKKWAMVRPVLGRHTNEPQKWLFDFRLSVLSNSCIMAMRQNDPKHKTREQER